MSEFLIIRRTLPETLPPTKDEGRQTTLVLRLSSRNMAEENIVLLEGDQTGQELLEESLRVLNPAVTGVPALFQRFDLSLGKRRATNNGVLREAAACSQNWKCGNRWQGSN